MGKPFEHELEFLPETLEWAKCLDLDKLIETISKYHHPVYIIGSGGSFSACVYAANLLTNAGVFAKAVTPLELFYSRPTIRKSNLIFISASGRNTDILFAFKKAVESEPVSIISICMRKQTKLSALLSEYSSCASFEFEPPSGNDGFLATNSLVAYFVILYRAITKQALKVNLENPPEPFYINFVSKVTYNTCFTILYSSYNQAVAVDIESKLSEAGLAPSLLSDFRHFAHGRHQWFDKRKDSAIIALCNPSDERLCYKTLRLLPEDIPKIVFKSSIESFEGAIHLLAQTMTLINYYGSKQGIDPGRPGVPEFGSKIYHLRYERLISNQTIQLKEVAIARKAKVDRVSSLSKEDREHWEMHYQNFIKKISSVKFGSLIFDYDGTLCSSSNRFSGMGGDVKSLIIDFVKKGFVIGIISGRGKSLRADLEKVFIDDPTLMKNVIVGYYNGSDIAPLTNKRHPNKNKPMHASLKIIMDRLGEIGIQMKSSPNQLTFGSKTTNEWSALKEILLNEMMLLNLDDVTMVESSHSIDIIPRSLASKNNILKHCNKLCVTLGLPKEALCIGDKGQWPGNDYALLANNYALSVGEVSSNPETGWNICPPSVRDEKAIQFLFEKLNFKRNYFSLANL